MSRRFRFHKATPVDVPLRAIAIMRKLTGAMRQNGEGDHAGSLKFSGATVNRQWFAPPLGGLAACLPGSWVNEMKGPSRIPGKTPNIRRMRKLASRLAIAPAGSGPFYRIGARTGRRRAARAAPSELQTQVEALLESGPFDIQGAHIAYPNVIYAFYSQRGFRPAWSDAHNASELRRALKDSEADGLDPRDYHLPILEQLAAGGTATSTLAASRSCTPMRCCALPITCCSGKSMPLRSTRIGTTRAVPPASTFRSESNVRWRATTSMPRSKS